jgi:fucose 4-O-acetylase-like acetyltransferase
MENKVRDSQFDNIRGLMILSVVYVHTISKLCHGWLKDQVVCQLYYFLVLFPIPVLAFMSGYFSKRKTDFAPYTTKALATCIIPYFVFQLLHSIPAKGKMLNLLNPALTLWFMLGLFLWKIMAEIFLRDKYGLIVAFAFSLYAGCIVMIGNFLALSRTICFFPFFLAGVICQKEGIERLRNVNKFLAVGGMILVALISWYIFSRNFDYRTMFFNHSYKSLKQGRLQGIGLRAIVLTGGFLCILFFFAIVTRKKTFLAMLGQNSITIYLGHSLILVFAKKIGFLQNFMNPVLFLPIGLAVALAICFLLGNKYVAMGYNWLFGKLGGLLLVQDG